VFPCGVSYHNTFYGEDMLVHLPKPKFDEDFLVVCKCLFNKFTTATQIWKSSPNGTQDRHTSATRFPLHMAL